MISTSDKYGYEWIAAPRNREVLVFEVRAGNSVRIALSDERGPTDSMYHVNIGDAENSLVWIGRGQHGTSYIIKLNIMIFFHKYKISLSKRMRQFLLITEVE